MMKIAVRPYHRFRLRTKLLNFIPRKCSLRTLSINIWLIPIASPPSKNHKAPGAAFRCRRSSSCAGNAITADLLLGASFVWTEERPAVSDAERTPVWVSWLSSFSVALGCGGGRGFFACSEICGTDSLFSPVAWSAESNKATRSAEAWIGDSLDRRACFGCRGASR